MVYTPDYDRYKHPLEEGQTVSPAKIETNMVIPSSLHKYCPCNYDGSPGSMESSGMMWMMKRLHTYISAYVYYA